MRSRVLLGAVPLAAVVALVAGCSAPVPQDPGTPPPASATAPPPGTAAADTVRATRRFVRRQRSWFRRDHRIAWLDGSEPDNVEHTLGIWRHVS